MATCQNSSRRKSVPYARVLVLAAEPYFLETCISICICVYECVYTHTYINMCLHILSQNIATCICAYTYTYILICIYMCIYVFLHTYIHAHKCVDIHILPSVIAVHSQVSTRAVVACAVPVFWPDVRTQRVQLWYQYGVRADKPYIYIYMCICIYIYGMVFRA